LVLVFGNMSKRESMFALHIEIRSLVIWRFVDQASLARTNDCMNIT